MNGIARYNWQLYDLAMENLSICELTISGESCLRGSAENTPP
jgi:hypothetical protein